MRKLYTASNLPDAYIVFHLLGQAGIEARVFNENAQGGLGEIPFTHAYPEVWLMDEADVPRAREVIADYEKSSGDRDVHCAACREKNPANFQVCWNCGEPI
jgi:hypothetical protein